MPQFRALCTELANLHRLRPEAPYGVLLDTRRAATIPTPACRQSDGRCSRRNPFTTGWAVSSAATPRGEALNFACSRRSRTPMPGDRASEWVGCEVSSRLERQRQTTTRGWPRIRDAGRVDRLTNQDARANGHQPLVQRVNRPNFARKSGVTRCASPSRPRRVSHDRHRAADRPSRSGDAGVWTPGTVRRGVIAGVVGNMLEWYDFALFGFFAKQIGAHFFPASNPTASMLAAYGTFAADLVRMESPPGEVRRGGQHG